MSRYDHDGWAPYVPVAERRRQAEREVQNLRRAGRPVAPVGIEGRHIATTFWGKAWCDTMESFRDYESRLPRGRSYVRNGFVVDLQIDTGKVKALVSGSDLYKVAANVAAVPKAKWSAIRADCSGGIDSLVELLQGGFSKTIMERLCRQDGGLFPKAPEIRFTCDCWDHASMCKHVAAVLYGVGARLDREPELLFRLRGVDAADLVPQIDTSLPMAATEVAAEKMLGTDDLSALFGLDMAEQPASAPEPSPRPDTSTVQGTPAPAAKSKSPSAAIGTTDSQGLTLTVAVLIPASGDRLRVTVSDGGKPARRSSIMLMLGSRPFAEVLAQAREFVEHGVREQFGPKWARWFRTSYGWQLTEVGFDLDTGFRLREPIPGPVDSAERVKGGRLARDA